ncbi:MAG: hypothetical protein U5K74_06210 [Gemmatimonadaceae bacterium]|nr:hypothetical protein [Gemmatimonadaceae bacterium]
MIDFSLLPDGGTRWLDGSGDHPEIVLSTRVRLARNVEGFAFTTRARDGERLRVLGQLRDAMPKVGALKGGVILRVDELATPDRQLLHERHLVSRELAGLDGTLAVRTGAAAGVSPGDGSVMVNEEDHLRLQAMRSGFDLGAAYEAGDRAGRELGPRFPYRLPLASSGYYRLSRRTRARAAGLGPHPPAGAGADEGDFQGAGGPAADGTDLSGAVRRGERGRRELLPGCPTTRTTLGK